MKRIIPLLLGLLPALIAIAQPQDEWARYYQPPWAPLDTIGTLNDVVFTTEGGFAMTGAGKDSSGNSVMWLLITDAEGQVTHQSFHPQNMNRPRGKGLSIIQDEQGGYVMGGVLHYQDGGERVEEFTVIRTNRDGELLWSRRPFLGEGGGVCYAVIELKSGNFLACGAGPNAIVLNPGGETVWAQTYADEFHGGCFRAVREIDGGALLAGFSIGDSITATVFKIDEEGNMVEHFDYGTGALYGMSSCPGGFAASGSGGRGTLMIALRIDGDGNQIWRHDFELRTGANCVAPMPDGGIIFCGSLQYGHHLIRLDRGGNIMWRKDHQLNRQVASPGWMSVITDHQGFAYAVGWSNSSKGVLVKVQPDVSPPEIVRWLPHDLELAILQEDSVRFRVSATDVQNDRLYYYWLLEEDTISANPLSDSIFTVTFSSLGYLTVKCIVSDGELSDSVTWHVTVTDLYIQSFTPDTLNLTLRRGASVDFTIDSVAAVGGNDDVQYLWTKTNLDNQQSEETGRDAGATIAFLQSGNYSVEGLAYREQSSDAVVWNVSVKGAIWSFAPEDITLEVLTDSLVRFEVFPNDPDSAGWSITWLVDGEVAQEGETALEWRFFGEADSCPPHLVQVVVADSVETDTVTWEVTVRELKVEDWRVRSPAVPSAALLSVSPNPFNSMLTIKYTTGSAARPTRLAIYDVSGREVVRLVDGGSSVNPPWLTGRNSADRRGSAEETSSATWNAALVPAGVYLVRLQAGQEVSTKKIVLIR